MGTLFIKERFLAFLIDVIIVSIITSLFHAFNFEKLESFQVMYFNRPWKINFFVSILLFYYIIFDLLNRGITIGKKMIGLQIRIDQYQTLSLTLLVCRSFLKVALIFSPLIIVLSLYFVYKDSILYDKLTKINLMFKGKTAII